MASVRATAVIVTIVPICICARFASTGGAVLAAEAQPPKSARMTSRYIVIREFRGKGGHLSEMPTEIGLVSGIRHHFVEAGINFGRRRYGHGHELRIESGMLG